MNQEVIAFLAKSYNREESGVASLFNEDGSLKENAISQLESWDKDRIKALREKDQRDFNAGYGKGVRETATKFEKELKEKSGIETELTGSELIDEVLTSKSTSKNAPATLTDDDVKKHPTYLSLEKKAKAELKAAIEAGEKKFNDYTAEQAKEKVFAQVADDALAHVMSLKPILPADAAKAKRRLTVDVVEPLKQYNWEKVGDEWLALDKDGKRIDDDHGHPLKFKDLVHKTAAQSLDFAEFEERSSTNSGVNQTKPKATFVPKNEEEYRSYLAKPANTDEEKAAKAQVVRDWNSRQS